MFRITDIRTIAIQIERNGERTYQQTAEAAKDPEIARMFRWLAAEECRHIRWFEALIDPAPSAPHHEELEAMGRNLLEEMIAKETFSLSQDSLADAASCAALAEQARLFEEDTILFYQFLRGLIEDQPTVRQLDAIIAEEQAHARQLARLAAGSSPGNDGTSATADWPDPALLADLKAYRQLIWFNPATQPSAVALAATGLSRADYDQATRRLTRFQPFIAAAFAETRPAAGRIESPLRPIAAMQQALATDCGQPLPGRLLLKCDHQLPISGSVKARGGIYEVLKHAEELACAEHLLGETDDYAILAGPAAKEVFGKHRLTVGSTGNLGLSIGIIGAALGFAVSVHMAADARQWKKDLLRRHGVKVIEHQADYRQAVAAARRQAADDPQCYCVDDEQSLDLFLGYATAAGHLSEQLAAMAIPVDADHPLYVYLPCGVGGAPGGITFGLKLLFGDHVHCYFAEPTHAPCMLVGLASGRHDGISVSDIGLDGRTAADGLAVSRPSGLVGRMIAPLVDGIFTVADRELYRLLALLADSEDIRLEPSALAGMPGPMRLAAAAADHRGPDLAINQATHIVWATGGAMVPAAEMAAYYRKGKEYLARP